MIICLLERAMPVTDNFSGYTAALTDPARGGQNVAMGSPGVDVELAQVCRAIRVGGDGTLAVIAADGSELSFEVAAGDIVPIRARAIKGSTTATNVVALW